MSDYLGYQPVRNDGIYDGTENEAPSSAGVVASERNAAIDETTMNKRITAVPGDDNKIAMDVAISLGDGSGVDKDNPIPVYMTDSPGAEIQDYDKAVSVLKDGGTANHDYITGGEFRGLNVECSSAGLAKFELQISTDAVPTAFETVMSKFNSVANPEVKFAHRFPTPVPAGYTVRVIKTNLEKGQDTDLYSLINGVEV